jgi:DNA (cytosine-5)-methyltransferase 1
MTSDIEPIRYGSVCSGIEALSVAMEPLGWEAAWFAEIDTFASKVLAHHWPHVQNLGDMTTIARRILAGEIEAPDVLGGGTPCQAFSVAGLRGGLSDHRGQLTLSYVELANAIDARRSFLGQQPCVTWWENVPGVLSSKDNAFGCFLGALAGESSELQPPGGKWPDAGCVFGPQRAVAWRILDAQYFGLAQRRRRVFVVASAREGFDPCAVLFEFDGVRRDIAPSREAPPNIAGTLDASFGRGRGAGTSVAALLGTCGADDNQAQSAHLLPIATSTGELAHCLNAGGMGRQDYETETMVVHGTQDPDVSAGRAHTLGRNNEQENAVLAFSSNGHGSFGEGFGPLRARPQDSHENLAVCVSGSITHALKAEGFDASEDGTGRGQPIVPSLAFAQNTRDEVRFVGGDGEISGALAAQPGMKQTTYVAPGGMKVRRLTPTECERLQGFPDNHTLVPVRGKPAADGPRYKALGNSMAVTCMRWIGRRIDARLRGLPFADIDANVQLYQEMKMTKPTAADTIRQQMIEHIDLMVRYWAELPQEMSVEDRCDGVAFSILTMLDGASAVPGMTLLTFTEEGDEVIINENVELHDEYTALRRQKGR